MDEKGVQMGIGKKVRALVDRTQKSVYSKDDGNKELTTLIECVCTDGTFIAPLAIFKGKQINAAWGKNNHIKAGYVNLRFTLGHD